MMLHRGDVVRLPHGRGNGVVIACTEDGHVEVYVGARQSVVLVEHPRALVEPIVEEYVECELIPTGESRAVAPMVRRRRSRAGEGEQKPAA
jgi:hypothetical protein